MISFLQILKQDRDERVSVSTFNPTNSHQCHTLRGVAGCDV